MLTELERSVMDTLSKPNGNGVSIVGGHGAEEATGDYLSLFCFGIDNDHVLGGVLTSLVIKGYISIYHYDDVDSIVELTKKGQEWCVAHLAGIL